MVVGKSGRINAAGAFDVGTDDGCGGGRVSICVGKNNGSGGKALNVDFPTIAPFTVFAVRKASAAVDCACAKHESAAAGNVLKSCTSKVTAGH